MTATTFVSYAQNFEDVMLWRALKDVECGFYVDVGAAEPEALSLTHAFHLRGWHGINIEPAERPFRELSEARPNDINIRVAVGNQAGEETLFLVGDENGWSTTSEALANRYVAEGLEVHPIHVPVVTLAEICRKHVTGPIHFLKIDVEGAERLVLEGADFTTYRPWIVVVEATVPNSQRENHLEWEHLVLDAGYHFVYFDGLNRFYVANEHGHHLDWAFAVPPNYFDGFVTARELEAEKRAERAEARLQGAEERAVGYQQELWVATSRLSAIYASKWWRLGSLLQTGVSVGMGLIGPVSTGQPADASRNSDLESTVGDVGADRQHRAELWPASVPWTGWRKMGSSIALSMYRLTAAAALPLAERVRTFLLADVQHQLSALQRQQFSEGSELERSVESALMTLAAGREGPTEK